MAREVEDAISACLDYPDLARSVWRRVGREIWELAQQNKSPDWETLGKSLREMFDTRMGVLLTLRKRVQTIEEAGERVNNAAQLERVITELTGLHSELLDGWPWPPTPEEMAEAISEFERGDSLPLHEAFAEIAGVSKEEWLARVEAHQREREKEEEGAA